MTLRWSGHEHVVGTLVAVGLRGVYSVEQVGREWWLDGVGHDDLPMLALPPGGKPFASLVSAQQYAQRLDLVKTVEAQVSGT